MQIEYLEAYLEKRYRKNGIRENLIGHEIKKRRKERNLTQDEIVDGICCISYLSKMENNSIKPNVKYVSDIMKRMNINEEFYLTTDVFTRYYAAILKDTFYGKDEVTRRIKDRIGTTDVSYLSDLLKLMHEVNVKENLDMSLVIDRLMVLKENMIEDDLNLFLLYVMIYLYQHSDYYSSYRIMKLIQKQIITNDMYLGIKNEYEFLINIKIDEAFNLQHCFSKYEKMCLSYFNEAKLEKIRDLYLEYIIKKGIFLKEDFLSKSFPIRSQKTKVLELVCTNQSHKAISIIKAFAHDKTYLIYALLVYVTLSDRKRIKEVYEEMVANNFLDYNIDMMHYINVAKEEFIERNLLGLRTYLRDVVIPYYLDNADIVSLNYYTEKLISILASEAQYKSAVGVHHRRNKRIEDIKMISWM